jgi:hypothetical protein
MTNFFYTGIAINALFFISLYAVNTTRALSDFHREANWALALIAAWVMGSLLFHRIGWNWLAAGMAWFTAIILPAAALACAAFFIFIVGAYQRPGGPIR